MSKNFWDNYAQTISAVVGVVIGGAIGIGFLAAILVGVAVLVQNYLK